MKRMGKVLEGSFMVTANMVGLYPSIPKKEEISTSFSRIPTNDLVK